MHGLVKNKIEIRLSTSRAPRRNLRGVSLDLRSYWHARTHARHTGCLSITRARRNRILYKRQDSLSRARGVGAYLLRLRKNDRYYSRFILPAPLRFSSISAKAISLASRTNRIIGIISKELNLYLPILKYSTNMVQSIRRKYPFLSYLRETSRMPLLSLTAIDFSFLKETDLYIICQRTARICSETTAAP